MELDQSTGETTWALKIGDADAETKVFDMSYSGQLGDDNYERLYVAGNN